MYSAEEIIRNKIIQLAEAGNLDYKLGLNVNHDNLVILDGYSKEGYKNISTDKVKFIKSFFRETGILLDPAYTGKAFAAFHDNFLSKKSEKVHIRSYRRFIWRIWQKKRISRQLKFDNIYFFINVCLNP